MIVTDATDLPRLIQCLASYSMPGYAPTPGIEDHRLEGDAAHWLASEGLRGQDIGQYIDRKAPNGHYIDDVMVEHVGGYIRKVRSRYGTRHIETPLTLTLADDITINCRPDVITDEQGNGYRYIWIDDFKYGYRLVEAERNIQLLAYAMAYARGKVFGPEALFMMTVHQPRPYHDDGPVRVFTVGILELRQWEAWLLAKLQATPTLQTGPSCYKCPARLTCGPYLQSVYTIFDFSSTPLPHVLPPAVLSELRDQCATAIARLENYANALDERITDKIKHGEIVPNYVLEPGTAPPVWNDGITIDTLRLLTNAEVSKTKPLTPTQLKRTLGEDMVKSLSHRPNIGLRLTRRDDQKQARKLFGKSEN